MAKTVTVTIYHNPRCSKSRATLDLLKKRGVTPVVIEYLKTPPSANELRTILKELGLKPRDLLRTKEPDYARTGLDNPRLSDAEIITVMTKHPILIERPIVRANGRAAIGRPPEAVLEIL